MIGYEIIEDEYNDIENLTHADTYAEALKAAEAMRQDLQPGHHIEIGLVRDAGDEIDGLQDRQWAIYRLGRGRQASGAVRWRRVHPGAVPQGGFTLWSWTIATGRERI